MKKCSVIKGCSVFVFTLILAGIATDNTASAITPNERVTQNVIDILSNYHACTAMPCATSGFVNTIGNSTTAQLEIGKPIGKANLTGRTGGGVTSQGKYLGDRYTSDGSNFTCGTRRSCLHYIIRQDNKILGTDKIEFSLASGKVDDVTINWPGVGWEYKYKSTHLINDSIIVSKIDPELNSKTLSIEVSRCWKWDGNYCGLVSHSTTYVTVSVIPPPPDINPQVPANSTGSNTTRSSVNDKASESIDYKNRSLNFIHETLIGTYLNIPNASSWTSSELDKYKPKLQNGTKLGSITNSTWAVSAATGPNASSSLPSASGNVGSNQGWTQKYNRTLQLNGDNVGKNICSTITVTPSWSKVEVTKRTDSGYTVGWNVAASSDGSTSTSACANVRSEWYVSGYPSVNIKNAKPYVKSEDEVKFTHTLNNNDHVVKDENGNWVTVTGAIKHAEYNGTNLIPTSLPFVGPNTSFTFNAKAGESKSNSIVNSWKTISADGPEIGKTYCQYITIDKPAWNNYTPIDSGADCVYIPYNYTTTLAVSGVQGTDYLFGGIEAGDIMTIGQALRVDPIQGTRPDAFYETKTPNVTVRVLCTKDGSGPCPGWNIIDINGNYSSSKTGDIGNTQNWQIPANSPVGTKYCFQARAVVNGKMISGVAGTTESSQYCVTIVKSPTMQIHGADGWSGVKCPEQNQVSEGGFDAKQPSFTPGSVSATWSQYGLLSVGSINNAFGSGGHIYNADSLTALQNANKLKFSGDSTDTGGNYLPPNDICCLTDILNYYKQRFTGEKDISSANLSDIVNGNRPKSEIGNKTIWWGWGEDNKVLDTNGVDLNGRDLTIIVEGDITIANDVIIYNGSYFNIASLPNFTVIASGNVIVGPNVTRLDGIYVAGNTFYDCGMSNDSVDFSLGGACSRQLIVNGAIIANSARFHRTYRGINGVDDNIFNPTPAEIISYPASIWLQDYNYHKNLSNHIPLMLYREVAPRV